MDIETSGKNIYLKNKVVSKLDLFVIDFINILKKYWFLNAENPMELYGMLGDKLAIRIAAKETVIPNIEIEFIKSDLDKASLDEHKVVNIGKDTINYPLLNFK